MKEVAGDVTHSLLHLDSRVWRTLRMLVRRPGELTREFIAGRHQEYIPPFRLYLAISILYFALSALLPESGLFDLDAPARVEVSGELGRELEAAGVPKARIDGAPGDDDSCRVSIFGGPPNSTDFEKSLSRACEQMRKDGGKRFAERFAATAPKLMFLFLPLMAGVALLFYWRPRRLYAEHLVLFLHNHAFTFLLLGVTAIMNEVAELKSPFSGAINFAMVLLWCWLPYYVYRSMRVVYGNGRTLTLLKLLSISLIYFVLLGITMMGGLVIAMWGLA
jgi:hypothetical protein